MMTTGTTPATDFSALFARQRQQASHMALTTASERLARINRIQDWIDRNQALILQAMHDDYRKPASEAMLSELLSLKGEIRVIRRQLRQWMKPQPVPGTIMSVGTRSYVRHEPKGNVLIIAPWNYPFLLTVKPLVSALAAGNVVILKPSELTPHVTNVLKRMVTDLFPPDEVALADGDASVAQALLDLPFNHIFFTGSPAVGKVVMAAAARHLTSVTLELGGKSPCIVDETANLTQAAEQIAWGKCINNGQTCIAPDYLLVQQSVKEPFLRAYRDVVRRMYDPDGQGVQASDSYCRIVNRRHFERVSRLIDDAVRQGARVTLGGRTDATQNFIEPTVLEDVTDGMLVMQEEIFGPVLPVVPYGHRDEALAWINAREKPLALYIHSKNRRNIDYMLARTTAGDTVINDVLVQFSNTELPFGGVNNSGIGKSNGFYSFVEFSNQRGVMERQFGTMKFIYPPYTGKVNRLIRFLARYL